MVRFLITTRKMLLVHMANLIGNFGRWQNGVHFRETGNLNVNEKKISSVTRKFIVIEDGRVVS